MDESKSLIHMFLSAMLAAMFIGAAAFLIGKGYDIWRYFSRQDMANQRMASFVNYVAYDNTQIRGQEVLNLYAYAKKEGICVFLLSNASEDALGVVTIETAGENDRVYYIPDSAPVDSIRANASDISTRSVTGNNWGTTALGIVKEDCRTTLQMSSSATGKPYSGTIQSIVNSGQYDTLLNAFTNNYGDWTFLGAKDDTKTFGIYKSFLIYDSEQSSEPFGVVLVRCK